MNNDYGHHVRRTWVDTHKQNIRTDPEIYLPGEHDDPDKDSKSDEDSNSDDDSESEDDASIGRKRKATRRTKIAFTTKIAKTGARSGPSTATLNVIDRRPDLTLIDLPVGENVLSHPYGRHSCLYVEVKLDKNKKPNPQEVVGPFFWRRISALMTILGRQ